MILLISAVFPPEPVVSASLTKDLALSLTQTKEVLVLTPRPSRPFGFSFEKVPEGNSRFKQVVLNSYTCPKANLIGRMRESYSFGKHASAYIRKNRNSIECIYFNVWPLLSQLLIVNAAKKYRIPSIIHVQDIYPESLSGKVHLGSKMVIKLLLPLDKYILKNASEIVVISKNMLNTLVKTRGISVNKIGIIPNWQNENDFIEFGKLKKSSITKELEGNTFIFMYLGNIGPVAGVDLLIESFAKAGLEGATLIIAGAGSQKNKCIGLAKSYKNAAIKFWDVPKGKVPQIQEVANVMLLPVKKGASLSSIPSKLPAYMFSKKPVIACVEEECDTANAIKAAECGWIITPEDTNELIKTLQTVRSIPEKELLRLGSNGFNYAIENFSTEKNLKKLVDIIIGTAARVNETG
jgi:glycosyltransferase involved in cell wall biosynthesis